MKSKILIFFLLGFVKALTAQNFHGEVTYKTMRNGSIDYGLKKEIQERINKHFQKTYVLTFNKNESFYKEIEKDEKEEKFKISNPSDSLIIRVMSGGGSPAVYTNLSTKTLVRQSEILGEMFIIKDSLDKKEWEISTEAKNIGGYTCFMATKKVKMPKPKKIRKSTIIENGEIIDETTSEDKNTNSLEDLEEEITLVAWYAPEIPVSHGPDSYFGLPGLILEINTGDRIIVCSDINLNLNTTAKIEPPNEGKEVSLVEFRKIQIEKLKDLNPSELIRN